MNRTLGNKWLASAGVLFLATLLAYIVIDGENETRRLEAEKVDVRTMEERLAKSAAEHSARLASLQSTQDRLLASMEARLTGLAGDKASLTEQLATLREQGDATRRGLEQTKSRLAQSELTSMALSARLSEQQAALEASRLANAKLSEQVARLEAESRARADEAAK